MKHVRFLLIPVILAVLLLALMTSLFLGTPVENVTAAPAAVPTPITQAPANLEPRVPVVFWDTKVITEDQRSTCFDMAGYNTLDLHYLLDQTLVAGHNNTSTFTLEFSNIEGDYPDGVAVVTANAADASNLLQFNIFGRWTCIWADVTTADPLTVTMIGVAK